MDRCPELCELEGFFGVAATSAYGYEGGWYYDRLKFIHIESGQRLMFEVEPAEGALSILYSVDGIVVFDVVLQHVRTLEIQSSGGAEILVGGLREGRVEQLFKLSLRPHVSFRLGTALPSFN